MAKKKQEIDPEADPKPGDEPTTDSSPPQTPAEPGSKTPTDWEASYGGLQKVVEKKDKTIGTLRDQLENLTEVMETLKADSATTAKQKEEAEKQVTDMKASLDSLETEKSTLDKQLAEQKIIMEEFPDLAPLAKYIPAAEDEEGYRAAAKEFAEAMGSFTDTKVETKLKGASPPQPPETEDLPSESEEDEVWSRLMSTAGVDGKEKEYAEAQKEWDRIQEAKQEQQTT